MESEPVDTKTQEEVSEVTPTATGFLFKKYSEIENTYREQAIDDVYSQGLSEGDWVVTEKIHGSNIAFYTDGINIQVAKRTGFLESDEPFFNINQVVEKYKPFILKAFQIIKNRDNPTTKAVRIHGEIFGGAYPHKDVKPIPEAIRVQVGVYYSPSNEFYGFDIHDGSRYVDYTRAIEIFKEAGFPYYAEPFMIGPLKEVLKYPHVFITKLPEKFHLPPINDNTAEGIVIKPVVAKFFRSGSRVIFKKKTEKFTEKFVPKSKTKTAPMKKGEAVQTLLEELTGLITMPRVLSVVSKIGQVTIQDLSKVISAYTKDVLEDFRKDHAEEFDKLKDEEKKDLTKHLSTLSMKIVKKYLQNPEEAI